MFIEIQNAYRSIEAELDPSLHNKRNRDFKQYDTYSNDSTEFKSRRGATASGEQDKEQAKQEYERDFNHGSNFRGTSEAGMDFQEDRWLRRYRYQHLRSKSDVPMSVKNFDRHGIENLQHDPVKPLDRIKTPAWMLWGTLFLIFAQIVLTNVQEEELDLEKMTRRNMLLAMKRTQEQKLLPDNEVSPGEQFEMKSLQFERVVTQ